MTPLHNFIYRFWLWITLALMASIASLSLYPLAHLPEVPGTDKLHHFIAYAALAFPTAVRRIKGWWLIIFALLAFSGAIELIQPMVNRYGEWLDLAANGAGLLVGIIIATVLRWLGRVKV